jgi:ribonuclease HI
VTPATKVYFDGGCRPNPGRIETAVVIRGIAYHGTDHGDGASMDAEWTALLEALRIARSLELAEIVLIGDALGVIRQVGGAAKCRTAEHRRFRETFAMLAGSFGRVRLRHVGRSQNLAGIALERVHAGLAP